MVNVKHIGPATDTARNEKGGMLQTFSELPNAHNASRQLERDKGGISA